MVMMHETEVEAHSILLVYFSMEKIPSLNRNVLVRRDKAHIPPHKKWSRRVTTTRFL
jgi:hypothetical protein